MALAVKKKSAEEGEGNVFWITMSDLLLGLAIIFMTLFVLAMTGFSQNIVEQKQQQMEASKELIEKLQNEDIEAQVDLSGDIKISDLELFEVGSSQLSAKGRAYLNKLIPIYIDTIFSKKELINGVENIVIQGHTDSQSYIGVNNPDLQYMLNMSLSLQRANSVAEHVFKTNFDKKYSSQLKKLLTVEGKSFSEPIFVNGKEDYSKSRRVELRLKIKKNDITDTLFNGVKF